MQHYRLVFFTALLMASCVKPKIYRDELSNREKCEAREAVLVKEVIARREDNTSLTQKIGELNRLLGAQDAELRDLKSELTKRTIQMGESSSKLAQEKSTLENDLVAKNVQLMQCNARLQDIRTVQQQRAGMLSDLQAAFTAQFPVSTGVQVRIEGERVLLTLPDDKLFENNGTVVSNTGKDMLKIAARVLATRPEVHVQVEAYTDNALPKDKSIKDTWDWSLVRATNLVRILISSYNVNANQLLPVGRGEFYPVASNETSEGRQKNRRTVLSMQPILPAVPAVE